MNWERQRQQLRKRDQRELDRINAALSAMQVSELPRGLLARAGETSSRQYLAPLGGDRTMPAGCL